MNELEIFNAEPVDLAQERSMVSWGSSRGKELQQKEVFLDDFEPIAQDGSWILVKNSTAKVYLSPGLVDRLYTFLHRNEVQEGWE